MVDWSNWTSYAADIFSFLMDCARELLGFVMSTPLLGAPFIVAVVGMIVMLVAKFVGALSNSGGTSEK